MYSDREAMKRQSTVLLADAAADDRLTKALLQIEMLSNELETVKQQNKEKVSMHTLSTVSSSYRRSHGAGEEHNLWGQIYREK